jgi:hypothetical protein
MATILKTGNFINVTSIAADVTHEEIFAKSYEVKVKSFEFVVGSANDKISIKNGSDASAVIAKIGSAAAPEPAFKYFGDGQYMKVFIDFSECTLGAGHLLIIELP